jgi:hypothetical protein
MTVVFRKSFGSGIVSFRRLAGNAEDSGRLCNADGVNLVGRRPMV